MAFPVLENTHYCMVPLLEKCIDGFRLNPYAIFLEFAPGFRSATSSVNLDPQKLKPKETNFGVWMHNELVQAQVQMLVRKRFAAHQGNS